MAPHVSTQETAQFRVFPCGVQSDFVGTAAIGESTLGEAASKAETVDPIMDIAASAPMRSRKSARPAVMRIT
jgi:hypothetical protein